MMNKQKSSKAGLWKVATFLPLLALLLMAFGKTGENAPMASLYQEKTTVEEPTTMPQEKVSTTADVLPQFPGGEMALKKFINDQLQYPKEAKAKGIQGKVFINFVVDSEGKVVSPKVVKSVDPALDAEALRIIGLMPSWSPGKEKGVPVRISYTVPINFVLTPESSNISIIAPQPPPPNKDKHLIWLRNDGKVTYNQVETTIDELAEKVKSELQKNPKLQLDILIEEGKIDERVDKITNILEVNGNPKVRYLSFHVEEGTDSKGLMWTKINSKPLDIK